MTKRSGNHKMQKERRKQAVAEREGKEPTQTWHPSGWKKSTEKDAG